MAKIITIGENGYFINKSTGEKYLKYIPDDEDLLLVTELKDGSTLNVETSQISIAYGGQLVFNYNNEKYIIDDGYQDLLIRAGYIILDNYNKERVEDKNEGIIIRNKFLLNISSVMDKIINSKSSRKVTLETNSIYNQIKVIFEESGYRYTVYIDTVNNVVNKNQNRRKNDLSFYPFDKEMDKYGTMYLSMFAAKISENDDSNKKYINADNFIMEFMKLLNESDQDHNYIFEESVIKNKINNFNGI